VKGTNIATVTDAEGNYSVNVPQGATSIYVSFVGMKTQESTIEGRTTIDIALQPDVVGLEEVVVTAMGIKRSEKALGYSAAQVSSDDISSSRDRSALNALQGKIPGVNVSTSSGSPGASSKIILRGYSSIARNNQPLFIVDGVPVNNSQVGTNIQDVNSNSRAVDFGNGANDINPDDIESMSILKGASAAYYGSRAANGVVIITTKSGKSSSKLDVNFTTNTSFSTPLRVPLQQSTFGQGWDGWQDLTQNGSWGPKFDGKLRVWGNVVDNSQLIKPYVVQKDNIADFYEIGRSYNNSLSLSGGNENTNYYFSYSNDKENGIAPGNNDTYDRNTFNVKGSKKTKKITTTASINYINKQQMAVTTGQGGSGGALLYEDIIQTPTDVSIIDMKDYNNKYYNLDNFYTPYAGNPYRNLKENPNSYNEDRLFGTVSVEYDMFSWLKAAWRSGTDISDGQRKDWVAIAIPDLNGHNASYAPVYGSVYEQTLHNQQWNTNFTLNANFNLTEAVKMNVLGGWEANQRYRKFLNSKVENLDIPGFYDLSNSSKPANTYTDISKRRLYAAFGGVDFSYNEYLFLNTQYRSDWSSTLPTDKNRYGYGGANLSFLFSEAFPDIKGILPYGKLRASIGRTGNDADPYGTLTYMTHGDIALSYGDLLFPLNGVNGFEVSNILGNSKIAPELTTEWETGAELKFFDSRFSIDFTYYNKQTTNQIIEVPISAATGYTRQVMNIGKVENKGIEISLGITPLKFDNFVWDARFNFTQNRGKVLELNDKLDKVILTTAYDVQFVIKKGSPLGVFEGDVPLTDGAGHVVVGDNGMPKPATDKQEYGTAEAKYILGISNDFKIFENLTIGCIFDIREGGLIYSGTADILYFTGNAYQSQYNDRQPFVVPNSVVQTGTDATTGDPIYSENNIPIDMTNYDDYYYHTTNPSGERNRVIDRSYVKLRQASIYYSLPKKWLTAIKVSDLSIGVVGRNLLLWTPAENTFIDPETSTYGNDLTGDFGEFRGAPSVRNFAISAKVSF
jgi:TonB-linked SusC/RagA family outer membrane protein